MSHRLDRLFNPRSIAIVGASQKPGYGRGAVESLRLFGFDGHVVAVHPTAAGPTGVPTYRSLHDLPAAPDAVVLAVPAAVVPAVVREAAEIGAGGVVAFASGFRESGSDGHALERDLLEAAGTNLPVLGPNCLGLVNYRTGAAMWGIEAPRHQQPRGGSVAVISQSGAMLITTLLSGRIPDVAYAASVGNQTVVDVNDCLEYLLCDPAVRVVALIVEGIDDLTRFRALAAQAHAQSVAVVALKLGRSARAQAASIAHTGTLAGDDAVFRAAFDQAGVVRVDDLDGLVAACTLLDHCSTRPLGDLAVFATSGGEGGLVADIAEDVGARLVDLDEHTHAALSDLVPPFGSVGNPFDLTAGAWGDSAVYERVTRFLAECPGTGLIAMVGDAPTHLDSVAGSGWEEMLAGAGAAARGTGVPVAVVTTTTDVLPEFGRAAADHDVVLLPGVRPALCAIAGAQRGIPPTDGAAPVARPEQIATATGLLAGRDGIVDETTAKDLVSIFGIDVPRGGAHVDPEELEAIANEVGYPVVCKIVGVAHKSDVGGVEIAIPDAAALRAAYARIRTATQALVSGSPVIRVEQMVGEGVEILVGGRRIGSDVVVVVGAGGVLTEVIADTQVLVWPFTDADATRALMRLRIHPLLTGYRGADGVDLESLAAVAVHAGQLLAGLPQIRELDLNPVIASREAAVAADALVVVNPSA